MNSLSTKLGADFDSFVRSNGTPLLRAAYVLTGDHGHAEDLVQLTLLRLARQWPAIRSSPRPYGGLSEGEGSPSEVPYNFRSRQVKARPRQLLYAGLAGQIGNSRGAARDQNPFFSLRS